MSVWYSANTYVHVPLSPATVVSHINASLLAYSSLLEQCSFSVLLDYAGNVLLQICLRMLERHCATTLLTGRSPFGPHWVFSLAVEGAPLQTWRAGCSQPEASLPEEQGLQSFPSPNGGARAQLPTAHGPFLEQGWHPCPLHWPQTLSTGPQGRPAGLAVSESALCL